MPPPASRAGADFDDEMTGLVQARTMGAMNSAFPAPIPAAGRPVTIPPRSVRPSIRPATHGPASMRPPPSSARASFESDEDAEDEDGGRTVVRPEGSGRGIRRTSSATSAPRSTPSANPTSISPAAVIRKTMESQRARGLTSGPPPELRGDLDDNDEFTQAAPSRAASSRSGAHHSNYPPASYEGPPSHRPPPRDEYRRPYDSGDAYGSDAYGADSYDASDSFGSSRSFAPRGHESGPISAPMSSPRSAPMSQPPPSSPTRQGNLPGHFATSQSPSGYAPPPNGVNPHGPTAAMTAIGSGPYSVPGSGPYSAPGSGPYNTMPSQPSPQTMGMNPANPAMPAHFRMAQTGAITPAMDPPGTAVTSNNPRVSGRPAMSWAAALAACGVFVGVVAVAIAQRGDGMADTQASFVDPAHTAKATAAQPVETQTPTSPLPPGLIGASPVNQVVNPAVNPEPATPPVQPVPGMADPNLGLTPPQAPAAAAAQPTTVSPPVTPPKPKVAAVGGGAVRPVRPPPRDTSSDDDEPPKKKKSKGSEADEETRKALEELRKAQLERGSSL